MFWIWLIAGITVVAAITSIWGGIDDREEIRKGRPSIETLVSYTGHWEQQRFIELFGEPDRYGTFHVPEDRQHEIPRTLWTRFFDHPLMDLLMLGLAALAPFLYQVDPNLSLAFLITSAGFELTGYIYAVGLVCKSGIWKKWFVSSDEQTTTNQDDD